MRISPDSFSRLFVLRISIQTLFRRVPLGFSNRWWLIFSRWRRREITSSFTVALTSVVRGFESATKPRACDSINNNGGDRAARRKSVWIRSISGPGALPVTVQKNHFARVWQRVISWIQNEYREEALPRSEFLFTSVIRWIKGPDAPGEKEELGLTMRRGGPKEERGGRRRGWDSRVLWQTRQRTVKLSRGATKSRYDEIRFIRRHFSPFRKRDVRWVARLVEFAVMTSLMTFWFWSNVKNWLN